MRKLMTCFVLLAFIASTNVQAQEVGGRVDPPCYPGIQTLTAAQQLQLSAQGYALGLQLGCEETSSGQNNSTVITTIDWADCQGIPIYGEGVMIGYLRARYGSPDRCIYCANISCNPPGGGGGGGGTGGGSGPIG
ncbi:MAG: hypothetical protein HEP71_21995 [Roseivirga sp.]|nr:hypothetical protein [Roseivirga sp.]